MDAGDQHAALLLATALAPAAALLFLPRCRPNKTRALFAVVVLGVTPVQIYHLCGAGTAWTQMLVPVVGGMLVVLFLAPRILAATLTLAIVASAHHLTNEYQDLVHGPDWTGSPTWTLQGTEARARLEREAAVQGVLGATEPHRPRRAGWLEVTGLMDHPPNLAHVTTATVWHTTFTRLWRKVQTPQRLWYPGGPPATAAAHLEWRDG